MSNRCDKCGCQTSRFRLNFDIVYCRLCWRNRHQEFGRRVELVGPLRIVDGYPEQGMIWNVNEDRPSVAMG